MKTITCVQCSKQKKSDSYISVSDALEIGFEVVYDISNGLEMIYLCQDCADKVRRNIRIIEDILNKPIDHINLMNFSSKGE